ncbi:calmodulin-binding protein 25 [Salvia miltiorrhiza]|uniref:calmodulin-binding protein 25 n=1 Tax=Salvia miltiorrhiza TaxID=226208 RepID=UPI0025AD38BF|nr:calmodulin-binding protein 25 [Salvia miltiorrhiza]
MASDNLMAMEQPWMFRPTFGDAWLADIFTKETDTLTKALQKSISTTSSDCDAFSAEMVDSLFAKPEAPAPLQTPTASGGSENYAPVSKQRRSVPPSGRVAKRKSRASKRATTTFITADPANFRQMVQQVTGVRFGGFSEQLPVLKPEPQRAFGRMQQGTALPTFDTSVRLLDGSAASLAAPPYMMSVGAGDGGTGAGGIDFDSFCSFPTLESSRVM